MSTGGPTGGNGGSITSFASSPKIRSMADETVMAAPPTVSVGTSTSAITGSALTSWTDARFRLERNYGAATVSVYSSGLSPNRTGGAAASYHPMRWAFDTDAPKFEIRTDGSVGTAFRIWINEQLVSATFTSASGDAADHLVLVDCSGLTNSGRFYKRVVFEVYGAASGGSGGSYFGGVRLLPNDTLYAPQIPAGPLLAVMGDSYALGVSSADNASMFGFADKLGRYLGWPNVRVDADSGTGFVKTNGNALAYSSRITDLLSLTPDVILLQGSINDGGFTAGAVQAAVASLVATIRGTTGFALTPIFVTGVMRPSTYINNDATVNTEVVTAVNALIAAGDARLFLIDPSVSPAWFTGTGKSGTNRAVTDGVLNSTTTVTSATANFVAGDVGLVITGTGIPANTKIASRTNSTTVVLSAAATATASGVTLTITNQTFDGNADLCRYSDGSHPTAQGHDQIARKIALAVASSLNLRGGLY